MSLSLSILSYLSVASAIHSLLKYETENGERETGNGKRETGNRKQEMWIGGREMWREWGNENRNLKVFEFLTTLSRTHCSFTAGCGLLFTGETAHFSISSIYPVGVTQKAINVPANNTCSFYFGEKLHAQYIGCDGDWREIPSSSVNESLEVTPGWNTSQLILRVGIFKTWMTIEFLA